MTLAELAQKLDEMRPGQVAEIHHDLYAELFRPENRTTGLARLVMTSRVSIAASSTTSWGRFLRISS